MFSRIYIGVKIPRQAWKGALVFWGLSSTLQLGYEPTASPQMLVLIMIYNGKK